MKPLDSSRWTARDGVWSLPLWVRAALVIAALGMFGLRLADRDLVPFILDEAQFQDAAQASVRSGTWASLSPLVGNLGLSYGPGPVWFYTAVHYLVGPRPERSVAAATLFLSLTQLLWAAALARALRGGWVLFATLTALLAASPFLFFWSRLAWEVFTGYTALAIALLATDCPLSVARGVLVGALLGLALSSHPMVVPLVLAVLLVLGWEAARRHSGAPGLLALVAALLVVNVPYLEALAQGSRHPALPGGPAPAEQLARAPGRLATQLLEPARVFTTTGVDYFFDAAWADFRRWLAGWGYLLAAGPLLTLLLALLGAAGLAWAARRGGPGARRVASVGLLAWAGHAVLLSVLGLGVHPHYQLATWWLVPAGVAALALALLPRQPKWAWGLLASVWLLAVAETSFNCTWMRWVRERGGTAGIHYSVPLAAQRAALREACTTARPGVALANRTYLFAVSLHSLASTEPACAGKRLAFCAGNCPPLDASWRLVPLRYAAPPGGRLAPVGGDALAPGAPP